MNIGAMLRKLRASSIAVTVFASVFMLAGFAEIGLGGMAVKAEYARITEVETQAQQASSFGSFRRQSAIQSQYNHSSSAFISQGRFIPSFRDRGWDNATTIAGLALLVSGLALILSALFWVWRAHENLARLGIRTKYTPRMAVAGFLVPVANLVLPFETMRELYNRSYCEPEELAHATVENVTAWWTAVVVGLLIFSAMIFKFMLDVGTNLAIITPLWMEYAIASFAMLLLLGSALLFAGLVRSITKAQMVYLPQIMLSGGHEPVQQRPAVTLR